MLISYHVKVPSTGNNYGLLGKVKLAMQIIKCCRHKWHATAPRRWA